MADKLKFRRDITENWENVNPVLNQGEPGFDLSRNIVKLGNGSDPWSDLEQLKAVPEGWVNVKDFGAKGDETTDIVNVLTTIETNYDNSIVYLPAGIYLISSQDITLKNVYVFAKGAKLLIASGRTVTFDNTIYADGLIFTGDGNVMFIEIPEVKSEWFIPDNTGSSDVTNELQKLINSTKEATVSIPIKVKAGDYLFSSTLRLHSKSILVGVDYKKSYPYSVNFLYNVNDGTPAMASYESDNGAFKGKLEGFNLEACVGFDWDNGLYNEGIGLLIEYPAYIEFVKNVSVKYFTTAIKATKAWVSSLYKPMIQYCKNGIWIGEGNSCYIEQPDISKIGNASNSIYGVSVEIASNSSGVTIIGGNLMNASLGTAVKVTSGTCYVYGAYTEETNFYWGVVGDGTLYVEGSYIKGTSYLALLTGDNTQAIFRDIDAYNITNYNAPFVDTSPNGTGQALVENWRIDGVSIEDVKLYNNIQHIKKYFENPFKLHGEKLNVTNNTQTDILSINVPTGNHWYEYTIKYRVDSGYYNGEAGEIKLLINRYSTANTVVEMVINNKATIIRDSTFDLNFNYTITGDTNSTQTVTISYTCNDGNGLNSNIHYTVESIEFNPQLTRL